MVIYWEGNTQITKTQYDAIQAKNAAWTAEYNKVGLDAMQSTTRQPTGKQPVPVPVASANQNWEDYFGIDVRKNLEDYLGSPEGIAAADTAKRLVSGKQPDTSSLNATDQDTLRRLQEEAERKRMAEQFETAAKHGKEIVFEFSKPVTSKANAYVSKLVKMLGGKRSYIEDQTKLVVVM